MKRTILSAVCAAAAVLALSSVAAQEMGARLHGVVRDENGGVIPGALVTAECGRGDVTEATSQGDGSYVLEVPAGAKCLLHVRADNFVEGRVTERVPEAGGIADFALRVKAVTADVVVHGDDEPLISADPAANAGALVLDEKDMESLPDDPDDLMEDLRAMAGPAPSGEVQLYTDGFTGQRLPPKSAIKQIKINQNPYSAQFDHVGLGRIEVLTKPGGNPAHGEFAYRVSDAYFDSQNPYATVQAPYRAQLVTASVGGPLTKKLSYFGDFQDRIATNNAVVNAQALDAGLNPVTLSQTLLVPAQNLSTGGRLDWQATANTALTGRFEYTRDAAIGTGSGGFMLGSGAYNTVMPGEDAQISATTALNRTTVNELRFQYLRQDITQTPMSTTPTVTVLDSFTGGGAVAGAFAQHQSLFEIQDYVSKSLGAHTVVLGGQTRFLAFENSTPTNFNGQYVFSGGKAPVLGTNNEPVLGSNGAPLMESISSLERYRRTLVLQAIGMTQSQIRALGGGASQYTVATGTPAASVLQFDFGAFVQDDWRVSKRLTLSAGLRWEGQNTIHRWTDVGPRLAVAWMPFGRHSRTVLRAGTGMFFERFEPGLFLNTLRYNGVLQQQYVVANPDFYPSAPPVRTLAGMGLPQTVETMAPGLRTPYLMQSSVSVEQALPGGTTGGVTMAQTLGRHLFYSANVAANLAAGNNYQYQSGGNLDETQVTVSLRRKYRNGFALFGNFTWTRAMDNTDGPSMFPVNGNILAAEWGRAATDIHDYAVVNGTVPGMLGMTMSPYLIVRSGAPFNITTGHDNNGDSIYNDRPGIATDPTKAGVVHTPYGLLDTSPAAGEAILPRNFGQGPDFVEMNLRVSRAFALRHGEAPGVAPAARMRRGWFYIPHTPTGPHITVSVTARNLMNHDNRGLPSGNLSSPLFDQANTLSSPTDPSLASYGNNRRIQFEARFNF
jgi:hypothetical protein